MGGKRTLAENRGSRLPSRDLRRAP